MRRWPCATAPMASSSPTTVAAPSKAVAARSNRCLPWCAACAAASPVLLDGGVRRGTDVYKALALGATAVGIGRPYVWGLASFGEEGVARVLDLLDAELRLAMVGCGARQVSEITRSTLIDTRT